jgi:hypothetical protein
MRLSMSVNGATPTLASLSSPGYLSAHLNMHDRPKESDDGKEVSIVATATGETETTRLKWPTVDLKIGDVVELRVLHDGEGIEPSEVRKSSESPYNLFSTTELAKEVLQAVSEFEETLSKILQKSKQLEPAEEHKKFTRAWGSVVWELGQNLLMPVYRRHKELIPEEMKGELL